jgi:hypothetical protein
MRVFVSWSGELSRRVAEILRNYLPLALQGLEVFMSQHDLESGSRWSLRLAQELEESSFGLLCLTPNNLQSAWLLFEAGALTKYIEGRACGILIGGLKATDVSGPLAQFQHRAFSSGEFRALLSDMNGRLTKPLEQNQVERVHSTWWPDIERDYEAALEASGSHGVRAPRDQREILEEILTRVRSFERTVDAENPWNSAATLRFAIARLSESERHLLRELSFAFFKGESTPSGSYEEEELRALEEQGFIYRTQSGVGIRHRLIAEYVSQLLEGAR